MVSGLHIAYVFIRTCILASSKHISVVNFTTLLILEAVQMSEYELVVNVVIFVPRKLK